MTKINDLITYENLVQTTKSQMVNLQASIMLVQCGVVMESPDVDSYILLDTTYYFRCLLLSDFNIMVALPASPAYPPMASL